ncbi:uncharacterized protein LOC18018945 [Eutrema salsugineum]|uniref:uncharacterized protein LOC18018945 n=1 Tax=Eutrema salsugineum TaxID=72664 RepID=UPI000CECE9FD|nr:uncharacterized protein LOC18018945 [Eutrema salsugineum]
MPGTGKTSTMVHAVKALLIRGSSILLASYTNSAVANLLIELKRRELSFYVLEETRLYTKKFEKVAFQLWVCAVAGTKCRRLDKFALHINSTTLTWTKDCPSGHGRSLARVGCSAVVKIP